MSNLWSVVVQDVGVDCANIWLGSLYPDLRKPELVRVILQAVEPCESNPQSVKYRVVDEILIKQDDWLAPFRHLTQRFFKCITFHGLKPLQHYRVRVVEQCSNVEHMLETAVFDTLAKSLSDYPHGLTVAMGSCFSEEYDGGAVSNAFQALYSSSQHRPHFSFLLGDQVYLDIDLGTFSYRTKDIRKRIARIYATNWIALSGVFRHGATWFLPDDHEFWNNYPVREELNPFKSLLSLDKVHDIWKQTSRDGVNNIQSVKPIRFIDIGDDLRFCIVDFRSQRTKQKLLPKHYFKSIIDWLHKLSCPGVLVMSQPLIDEIGKGNEKNLPNYAQYDELVTAIANAKHDILVLAGDLHMGRIATVHFAPRNVAERGTVMHEVVASPLSNLSGPTSIATCVAKVSERPTQFPITDNSSVATVPIQYPKNWRVSSSSMRLPYLAKRTKEHFKTVNFKQADGHIAVEIKTWLVRKRCKGSNLPQQDHEPVTLLLQ